MIKIEMKFSNVITFFGYKQRFCNERVNKVFVSHLASFSSEEAVALDADPSPPPAWVLLALCFILPFLFEECESDLDGLGT